MDNQSDFIDDLLQYPPLYNIIDPLLSLINDKRSRILKDKALSCLCGLARNDQCFQRIATKFDKIQMGRLLEQHDIEPSICRSLFLLYAYIMESRMKRNNE